MSNKMANAMMNKDEVIKNRYNFSFFIEVVYGNINGDPETDGTQEWIRVQDMEKLQMSALSDTFATVLMQ